MVTVAIANQYFDGSDYNQSIKSYVDSRFYFPLDGNFMKITNF